ncbi:Lin1244/Lin1753 domain-containing protein [Companilactobacillus futsaii]|nr:Lin1244/Lin1753 domain-containing protein [Companilactobacillus futsaii]
MNNYFSHDSNARNSSKMLQVRMKYGAEGYGIYFMLLERLRDEDDYKSVKDYNAIAFDLRVDASIIKAVVEDFGLFVFTDDGKYFYSEGFNKRMAFKDEKSKRRSEAGKKGAQKRWANKDPRENDSNSMAKPSDQNSNTKAMPLHTDSKESKVNKSKVNKSKVNKSNKDSHDSKPAKRVYDPDDINLKLANYLLTKIRERNSSIYPTDSKNPPDTQKWANDIRLMHERDARSYDDIKRIIEWCQQDSFWQNNILSASKLRKQFGKLIDKADAPNNFNGNKGGRKPLYDLPY